MNPKEAFHNTAYSVQLPYIAGHSLYIHSSSTISSAPVFILALLFILAPTLNLALVFILASVLF